MGLTKLVSHTEVQVYINVFIYIYLYNSLEDLLILQVKSQAYLSLKEGITCWVAWVFVDSSDYTEISIQKKSIMFLCALLFFWEIIPVNSLPLDGVKYKCKNVLWLTEEVKEK